MWTSEGSQTLAAVPLPPPQSPALRKDGARRKAIPLAPPAIWPGKRTLPSNCEDRMASAGGKDWRDGDSTTISMAAEKKPDRRATHSIALPRRGHCFLAPGRPRGGGFDHSAKTPCRREMASSGSAARLGDGRSKRGAHRRTGTKPPRSSIGSRRALLAGGGSALGVAEKRAGIHERSGEVNGGGLGNRAAGCGGGTHQPTAASDFPHFVPLACLRSAFFLSARWRDGGG
uniref:Uncharacterized protein n=1 Tax=Arundo donax TaxID=35708 RepID=A0A0A9G6U4_ARUDO